MKKSLTFLTMALLLLISGLGWAQPKAEEVYSTCLFGSSCNSQGVGSYTATWYATNGDYTWAIVNGNNNNNGWSYVKFGRKNNASVGEITTDEAYDQAITKVDLTIDNITAANVNSIKLYTSSDNSAWTEEGSFAKASGLQSVSIANPATSLYYKVEFDCASGSANGLVTVSKVEYYYNTGGAASPTITADNVDIAYDATSGEIEYTVNNAVAGGVLSATTEAEWLTCGTVGEETVPFTCEENEAGIRTATVTLTYTYNNDNVNKNVTVTQAANPNGPGSQANPYTVAQARAAIDANTGLADVYATGIISQVDSYNSNYNSITYWISDDGTTADQLEVYSGRGLDNANFTSIDDVEVGATVVVFGTLKKYGSTYEFDKNNYLVDYIAPVHDVETPTFTPVAGSYDDPTDVVISCATEGASIYYTLDGTDPSEASTPYTESIHVSTYTTIKAIAYVNRVSSAIATATYHIVSADNPYTVAQALSFNEYPANNIYVHGIVSTAPTSLSSGTLTYYISDDGQAQNELEVYKGKGLDNISFTAVDDIQVGDIVTITGNVQVYNNTIEFSSGNYLVYFERPQSTEPSITVANATVNVGVEGAEGTLTVTYENITDIVAEVYFCDPNGGEASYDWITADINSENNVEYLVEENDGEARTAYFKVYALDDNAEDVYSNLVTISQEAYVAPALDYATLPFEFDGGRADIENTDGLTQEGIDSDYGSSPKLKFNTTGDYLLLHFNEVPGKLTFDIKGNGFSGGTFTVQTSEDGVTYTDLETYTELTTTYSEEFNTLGENVRYIKWIYTAKVNGNVALGNIVLAKPSSDPVIVVEPDLVEVDAEEHNGTLTITYQNLTIADLSDFDIEYYDAEGEATSEPDWIEVLVAEEQDGSYVVSYYMMENEGEAREVYFKVLAMGFEDFAYSNLVTVSQAAPVAPATGDEYVLFTGDLVEGDYVICYDNSTWTAAMKNTVTSGRLNYEEVIPANDVVTTDDATIVWHIAPSGDYWTIYSADANAYAAGTGVKNKAQMLEDGTDDLALWTVTGTDTYDFVNRGNDAASVNAYLRNNGTYGFACYAPGTGGALSLYKKVEAAPESYTLEIKGYEAGSDDGYYLIASPVNVNPAEVQGMTEGEFDLYYFDESQDMEWINYKGENGSFNLEPGKGYLYAKKATTEGEVFSFELSGTPYDGTPITLAKVGNGEFQGWNLVGNPFADTAYINRDFYVMKEDGSEIITGEGNKIAPMQGFFVIAEQDGEELAISTEAPSNTGSKIVVNVTQNRGNVIDRAIVRFGEGRQLPKFMMNPGNTKLFIAQADNEYAVVRSANEGEMPVSFKAAENGYYTLNIKAEDTEMGYLHLIDNMTGADVDLLSTPNYTFQANTTDYANRFCLVYAATTSINESASDDFAFFNGNEWVINSDGEATLQVIDMTGRVLSSQTVNGNTNLKLNQANGVYLLRLLQNNTVKNQKIVKE